MGTQLRHRFSRATQDHTPTKIEPEHDADARAVQRIEAAFAMRVRFTIILVQCTVFVGRYVVTGTWWWVVMLPGAIFIALHATALWLLGANRASQTWLLLMLVPAFVFTPLCLATPSKEFIAMHEEVQDGTGTMAIFFCVGLGHAVNLRSTMWKVLGGASFVATRLAGELLLARAHSYPSFTPFYVWHGHLPFVAGAIFGQLLTYTLVEMTMPLHASLREAERRNGELEQARQEALIREFQRSANLTVEMRQGRHRDDGDDHTDSVIDSASSASHHTAKAGNVEFMPEAASANGSDRGSHHTTKAGDVEYMPEYIPNLFPVSTWQS